MFYYFSLKITTFKKNLSKQEKKISITSITGIHIVNDFVVIHVYAIVQKGWQYLMRSHDMV
jgi:hypothetical protein